MQKKSRSYKVGAIVLATDQGLGYLAKSFYDNGLIDVVFIHKHSQRVNHTEWYDNTVDSVDGLLDCDTLLFFETVFHWKIIKIARERGIKTVLMPMYECTNNPLPLHPDMLLAPSDLDLQVYPTAHRINVPVEVPWKLRERAVTFVHNAGNGGLGGRNGTKEVIEAMKLVKSPIKLILRSQRQIGALDDERIDLRVGQFDDIWSEGDVFLFPEKFNGLSLPLQEAYASGMLVMCGDRFPMNEWLPTEPMIPVQNYATETIARPFQCAQYDPIEIARKIDKWYNQDITKYSLAGKEWGKNNSWNILKEKYETLLSPLSVEQDS
jgi:hypothetical protein